jgi:PAS domain S-box-containing protein
MPHQEIIASIWKPVAHGKSGNAPFWRDPRTVFLALLTGGGYYLGSLLGFALTFRPNPVSVLWPPNSILLAALLLAPTRLWWLLLLAAFPAHCVVQTQTHIPPLMILCYFTSNSLEALIGAGCIRYFLSGPMRFDNLRGVVLFCLFGAFLGPFISSFIDAGFVVLNGWGSGSYADIVRIRFFSNVLTALALVPAIVTWLSPTQPRSDRMKQWRGVEAGILFCGLLAVSLAALYSKPVSEPMLFYAPLPILLWAALRFGARGTASAVVTITFLAIWSAAHGHGPFTTESPEENARSIQMFLIVIAIPFLFLGAVIEERRKANERFSTAFRCNPDAIWIARLHTGTIYDVNEQWEKLFGHRRAEAIGRNTMFELNLWSDVGDRTELVQRLEEGPVRDFELFLRNKAGENVPLSLSADRVDMDGEACLIVIVRDMTDRRRADEAARDLVRASRLGAMGELTASLAHELNQPLTAIASNAAAGRRFLDHGSSDGALIRELLEDVRSDARRASDIIQGIHHLVRKEEETRRPVNVNQVITEVLRLLHSDCVRRSVSVRTEFAFNIPEVAADPIHLQQVMLNLLLNSLEAMRDTPAAKRLIVVSTRAIDSSVTVSVRDHGVGLPIDDPKKVMAKFYTTKPNGMGMGLSIVRSIVEAHGGDLIGQSTEDGACFSFRLPIAVAATDEKVA